MRILIATGIFEPEAGGPATYTPKIAAKLVQAGNEVTVITYSDKKKHDLDSRYPFRLIRVVRGKYKLANYYSFFRAVSPELVGVDVTYSLDWIAAGLPLTLAAMIKNIPVVIRVGGDYIWEKYLQSGGSPMPLAEFNERGLYKHQRILFWIIIVVLRRAFVVFNSDAERDMYRRLYGLREERTGVIHNPMPEKGWLGVVREKPNNELVFAGRFIAMKNITSLLAAYATARTPFRLVLMGEGPEEQRIRGAIKALKLEEKVSIYPPMRQQELFERIKNSRALVLPSWTDIAPNQVSEAIALGIPILVTKENFLVFRDQLPDMLDPASVEDIRQKLEMLADEMRYQSFAEKCRRIEFKNSWDDVVTKHLGVFGHVLSKGTRH
ncbi:MAG: glycosyltransferase (group 1) [Parcubacteria group bacterium Gr01-1014_8]|nr:MAG: glycosyltransferase (group 1) [Parcubacteria group bacterium Gr01-1014_8]